MCRVIGHVCRYSPLKEGSRTPHSFSGHVATPFQGVQGGKEEKSNCTVEKPEGHDLGQAIKVNTNSNKS